MSLQHNLIHFGWAFFGQECLCGEGISFNWLAKLIGEGDDSNGEPIAWKIGNWLVDVSTWLLNKEDD